MSLISLVYPIKHIIYQTFGEIGEMPYPTLFVGYVERVLSCQNISSFGYKLISQTAHEEPSYRLRRTVFSC